MIIELGDTLISTEIFDTNFVCNLSKCKGACCIEGNRGAPLEIEEINAYQREWKNLASYLNEQSAKLFEKEGFYEGDDFIEYATTCHPTGECIFAYRNDGCLSCGIEKAYKEKAIETAKPISCHLYPIRLGKVGLYTTLNYHKWDICSAACSLGDELKVPVFKFLKDPLVRQFGMDWYQELESIYEAWLTEKK